MQMPFASTRPRAIHEILARGEPAHLIDVRSRGEYADGHAAGAVSVPLDEVDADRLALRLGEGIGTRQPLHLICASGIRAEQAARKLQAQGLENLVLVEGGTQAWAEQRLPIRRTSRWPSLERQTQIALGVLVLVILVKGALLHPLFYALIGLLGVGLIVSGVTSRCGLSALLARMPWNRAQACETGGSA